MGILIPRSKLLFEILLRVNSSRLLSREGHRSGSPSSSLPRSVSLSLSLSGKQKGFYSAPESPFMRVSGFKNKAPQFQFICCKNVALSIDSDKTDESEPQTAVKNAMNHLKAFNASLIEYTSYANTSSLPGHYVLYWEVRTGSTSIPPSVFEDYCLTVEESLNSVYRQGLVSDKSIGPPEIKIVETGTFDKLMDYALSRGASINQHKTPH